MSTIQAIIFNKSLYTLNDAIDWLVSHNFKPIKKVHETVNFYRFRMKKPMKEKKYF